MNKLNKIGDTVVFRTVPLWNLQSLSSFTPNLIGVTATRTVITRWRFSLNGINYTEWVEGDLISMLATINDNLTTLKHSLIIDIEYERSGTDTTGQVVINSIEFNGVYSNQIPDYSASMDTELGDYVYDDINVFNLMINLTQKIYDLGIIPVYIERGENPNDLYNDKDYVDFWSSVAQMYAVLFEYSIKFTIIYWRKELLCEFLKQKTLQFCGCNDIVLLQQLAKNYYDEIRQRGTVEIFRRKDYEYPMGARNKYELDNFLISRANPIWIDGVKYMEIDELPYGWVLYDDGLSAPDLNHYQIQVADNSGIGIIDSDFDYSIIDELLRITIDSIVVQPPTHFSGVIRKYHGEYLRLICYCMNCDEFIYNLVNKKDRGWNIGNSSPLYKGLRNHRNTTLLKGYENFTDEVWDLSYYPIIGEGVNLDTNYIAHSNDGLINHGDGNIPYTL